MIMMAERSSCVKVITKCQRCSRKIKRCSSSKDNLCDNCNDKTIKLCTSSSIYHNVKKINILSGLLVDRKNKFLIVGFVGEVTVAFNAYRKILCDKYDDSLFDIFKQQHFRIHAYPPGYMVAMLIHLHESTITGEYLENISNKGKGISTSKLTESVIQRLNVSYSELQKAQFGHQPKPPQGNCGLAKHPIILKVLKHLFKSIQEVNSANAYLLELIKVQEKINSLPPEIIKSLNDAYVEVKKATGRLKAFLHSYSLPIPNIDTEGTTKHEISRVIVDDMAQDAYVAAGCVTQPPIDIISSSLLSELPQCRINEVMGAMLRNSGDYKEEEIVGILNQHTSDV